MIALAFAPMVAYAFHLYGGENPPPHATGVDLVVFCTLLGMPVWLLKRVGWFPARTGTPNEME